jgi:hypothetical protein
MISPRPLQNVELSRKGGTVGTMQTIQRKRRPSARDEELRLAHQLAFDKILEARSNPGYREVVTKAVEELIDACEAYVS